MKLNKEDMIKIVRVLENNTNTMLEMEEQNYENNKQYMKMEQQLFHEKWKVRYLTRRIREIAPHEALSEEELVYLNLYLLVEVVISVGDL